jgi:hypothetical protein
MVQEKPESRAANDGGDAKKPKGSYPPRLNLAEAGQLITDLYERTGSEATFDELSEIFGNTTKSSAFQAKLVCLKKFGLIDPVGSKVRLSVTANSIVAPLERSERAEALKATFVTVSEFANVYLRLVGKILPEDKFLQNSFLEYGGKELAPKWMESFKASAFYAGLLMDRGDGKLQVRELGKDARKSETRADDAVEAPNIGDPVPPAVTNGVKFATAPHPPAKSPFEFLIEILNVDMTEAEQGSVWTLIQYLKRKETASTQREPELDGR